MAYKRRYRKRRRSAGASIIREVLDIGSRVSWQGALWLGAFCFGLFYWLMPVGINALLEQQSDNMLYPALVEILGRRIHWVQWLGIVTGLIGVYFAIRNYFFARNAGYRERGLVGFISKLLGRSVN